jgi:hypothetical protein
MSKKYCMNCGREMEEGATFCPYCGEKDGYIAADEAYEEDFQESGSNRKKGGFPKWLIVILVILLTVIVAAVVIGVGSYKSRTSSGTDTEEAESIQESVQSQEETQIQDANEPNEVPDAAARINEGDTVTGYLESASDVDYYVVKADADGKAAITFQHAADGEQSSVGWRLNYSDDGTISTKLCWMNSDTTDVTIDVKEGDNYFYISADDSVSADVLEEVRTTPYYISVKITEAETKEETEVEEEEEEEVETEKKAKATSSGYIIPDSSSRYLTASDVSGLSKSELRLARNEIYARHGRRFDDEELQAYFDSKSWYNGTIPASDFSNSALSKLEKANVDLIKSYE